MTTQYRSRPSESEVEKVLDRYTNMLMAYPNVTGVGIGEISVNGGTRPVVQVYVSRKLAPEELSADIRIPDQLEGIPVHVEEVGQLALE